MRPARGSGESSAERSVTAANARTGAQSGQAWARRIAGSRRRHSQSAVSRASADCDSVIESPRPTTNAARRTWRAAVTSVCVPLEEDPRQRQRDDLNVQPERPALDVLEVVLDALLQRRVAAPSFDLRPARHARLDLVREPV